MHKSATTPLAHSQKTAPQPKTVKYPRVLAITPMSTGFGYALLYSPDDISDWGVTSLRKNRVTRACRYIDRIIGVCMPDVIVMMDTKQPPETYAYQLLTELTHYLRNRDLPVRTYTRQDIRTHFATLSATTIYEISGVLAARYHPLALIRPERRAPWGAQDPKTKIFDAVAAATVFYDSDYQHAVQLTLPL